MTELNPHRPSGWIALSPLGVFIALYVGCALWAGDFNRMPISVAFVFACATAVATTRGHRIAERIARFSKGAAEPNIQLMLWIFILAGAFAASAKAMGAIDATVALTLHILPEDLLFAGFFLAACFISLSIGTSVGTIVALTPVAIGLAQEAGIDPGVMLGVVVGGSFFGDNLSFISDTTIAATKTQGCAMRDKFRTNARVVIPAAVVILGVYIVLGWGMDAQMTQGAIRWTHVVPYAVVLGAALAGINVLLVLAMGIGATAVVGFATGSLTPMEWFAAMGSGIAGMSDLVIVTLLAGGMLELIRYNGGIDLVIRLLTRRIRSERGAELAIGAMVSAANLATANNTIAILTTGPIAADISRKFALDRRRVASILDTFSCFTQGMLPYGAQLMMAAGLAGVSAVEIIAHLYYPLAMGLVAVAAILCRKKTKVAQ